MSNAMFVVDIALDLIDGLKVFLHTIPFEWRVRPAVSVPGRAWMATRPVAVRFMVPR